jgi:ribosomal protein S5
MAIIIGSVEGFVGGGVGAAENTAPAYLHLGCVAS